MSQKKDQEIIITIKKLEGAVVQRRTAKENNDLKKQKVVYTPKSMCYTIQDEFSPCSGTGHSDHPLICGGQSIIIIEYRRKSK